MAIRVPENSLVGTFPTFIPRMSMIGKASVATARTHLFVGLHNPFCLSISDHLDIASNSFFGAIPSHIGLMTKLSKYCDSLDSPWMRLGLLLTVNRPCTPFFLPESLVAHLALEENGFVSTIPTELGQLTALDVLDLGANQLSGTIPTEIGLLGGVGTFDCDGCL